MSHLHSRCTVCTQSEWGCRWCIYENKCVDDHEDTTCSRSQLIDDGLPDRCPRLLTTDEADDIIVPSHHKVAVVLPAENLPDDMTVGSQSQYHVITNWHCYLTFSQSFKVSLGFIGGVPLPQQKSLFRRILDVSSKVSMDSMCQQRRLGTISNVMRNMR